MDKYQEILKKHNYSPDQLSVSGQKKSQSGQERIAELQGIRLEREGETFIQDTVSDVKGIKEGITQRLGERADKFGEQKTVAGRLAQGLGFASDVAGETVVGLAKAALPQRAEEFVADKFTSGVQTVSESIPEDVKIGVQKLNELKESNPAISETIDLILNATLVGADVAGAGIAAKGAKKAAVEAAERAPQALERAFEVTNLAADKTEDIVRVVAPKIKQTIKPSLTLDEAIGQISRAKSEDLSKVKKALQSIDTNGVKTYKELQETISNSIPDLANAVDQELLKDTGIYSLNDLSTVSKTAAGKSVTNNYVKDALDGLTELYEKTGNSVKKADAEDLLRKATEEGLERVEVNNIARQYGLEFGSKAFNKVGDPLTSVNAQKFENIRSGVKEVARRGLGGDAAQALDQKLASLFTTQKLIQKQAQRVNDLTQRIKKRGLLEKVGAGTMKTLDALSGGLIRGLVGGVLPRGVGNKLMNALDLEKALRNNLRIIEKAVRLEKAADIAKQIRKISD